MVIKPKKTERFKLVFFSIKKSFLDKASFVMSNKQFNFFSKVDDNTKQSQRYKFLLKA